MNNNVPDPAALSDVATELSHLSQLVQAFHNDLHTGVASLTARVEALEKSVAALSAILRDGNGGERALVTRFALLTREVQQLKTRVTKHMEAGNAVTSENVRGRWKLLVARISAFAALILGFIQLWHRG